MRSIARKTYSTSSSSDVERDEVTPTEKMTGSAPESKWDNSKPGSGDVEPNSQEKLSIREVIERLDLQPVEVASDEGVPASDVPRVRPSGPPTVFDVEEHIVLTPQGLKLNQKVLGNSKLSPGERAAVVNHVMELQRGTAILLEPQNYNAEHHLRQDGGGNWHPDFVAIMVDPGLTTDTERVEVMSWAQHAADSRNAAVVPAIPDQSNVCAKTLAAVLASMLCMGAVGSILVSMLPPDPRPSPDLPSYNISGTSGSEAKLAISAASQLPPSLLAPVLICSALLLAAQIL